MIRHDQARELLAAGLDFDLSAAERTALEDHLRTCATCATFSAGLQADARTASAWPAYDAPAAVRTAVFAGLEPGRLSIPRSTVRLIALGLVVGLLVLLSLLAFSIAGGPRPSGLLVIAKSDGVYTLDPSSRHETKVAGYPAGDGGLGDSVQWSADGQRFFLLDGRSIKADGTGAISVGQAGGSWSPDGLHYAEIAPNGSAIEILGQAGRQFGPVLPLPAGVAGFESGFAWSPDGRSLAFAGCPTTSCESEGLLITPSTLWVMPIDGTSARRLTAPEPVMITEPTWSPNGRQLAYETTDVTGAYRSCQYIVPLFGSVSLCMTAAHLFVANIASGTTNSIDPGAGYVIDPSWSPDGTQLALASLGTGSSWQIDTARADGSVLHTIAEGGLVRKPIWAPDGQWIAYGQFDPAPSSSGDAGNSGLSLWIVAANGSSPQMIDMGTNAFDWRSEP